MKKPLHLTWVVPDWSGVTSRPSLCGEECGIYTVTTLHKCNETNYHQICSKCLDDLHRRMLRTTGVAWLDRDMDLAFTKEVRK